MKNGDFIIYCIEQRTVAESPWLKLDRPLKKVADSWSICGGDYWGRSLNPHIGRGNDWRPRNREADQQFFANFRATEHYGWNDLKYAVMALRQCRKDDAIGMYNSVDGYGHVQQIIRHEFRMVKITIHHEQTVETVNAEDFVSA